MEASIVSDNHEEYQKFSAFLLKQTKNKRKTCKKM